MQTNEELIKHLIASGILYTDRIIDAFRKVDRKDFVTKDLQAGNYVDSPLPIPAGMTISQPTTVAFMLELLKPKRGDRILDVGAGSGWTTALLAELVGESGAVFGIELEPELVTFGKDNLAKYDYHWAQILRVRGMGLPDEAPYDRILVSASAESIPDELVEELIEDGTMVCPMNESIYRIVKSDDMIQKEEFPGFRFVPLRSGL